MSTSTDLVTPVSSSEYVGPDYEATEHVEMFRNSPRFGHSDDITSVIDSEKRMDYISGVLFIALFCLSFFIVWSIVLLAFKVIGKKGCKAGARPSTKRVGILRIMFLIFTAMLIASTTLLPTRGTELIAETFNNVKDGATLLKSLIDDSIDFSNDILETSEDTIIIRDQLVIELDSGLLCPTNPGMFQDLTNQTIRTSQRLKELEEFMKDGVERTRDSITEISVDVYDAINATILEVEKWEKGAPYYSIPIFIPAAFLCLGVLFAWFVPTFEIYFSFQSWVIIPLFYLVILGCILFVSMAGVAGVLNADFCMGGQGHSPEGTIEVFVENYGDLEGKSFDAFKYYITTGCRSINPMPYIDELMEEVALAVTETKLLTESLESSTGIEALCGREFGETIDLSKDVTSHLESLEDLGVDALRLLSCERINDIFITVAHDGICDALPTAFVWIFMSSVAVSISALLMFSIRAACLPAEESVEEGSNTDVENETNKISQNDSFASTDKDEEKSSIYHDKEIYVSEDYISSSSDLDEESTRNDSSTRKDVVTEEIHEDPDSPVLLSVNSSGLELIDAKPDSRPNSSEIALAERRKKSEDHIAHVKNMEDITPSSSFFD